MEGNGNGIDNRLAQASGMVSAQAACSCDEAVEIMRQRAAQTGDTLAEIAGRVLDRSLRFSPADRTAHDPIELVWAMWEAERLRRTDDMVATLHPEVTWRPITRLGQEVFSGHAEFRKMRDDIDHVRGAPHVVMERITLLPDGRVLCRGHASFVRDGEKSTQPFEAVITVRDGLVFDVDVRDPAAG